MPPGTVNEMAAQFTAAYQALKDKKDTERLLTLIKPMILTAKADGISDKELIDLINALGLQEKFYPAKLKELRGRLGKAESDAPANGEEDPPANEGSLHPLAAALSGCLEGGRGYREGSLRQGHGSLPRLGPDAPTIGPILRGCSSLRNVAAQLDAHSHRRQHAVHRRCWWT